MSTTPEPTPAPSNDLTAKRTELAALLATDDLLAFAVIPAQVTPPFVYVAPGDPYLDYEGAGFGGAVVVRLQVGIVVEPGVNDLMAEQLDELVIQVLGRLNEVATPAGYVATEVGRPGQIAVNGQPHIAAPISVVTEIRL